MDQNNTVTFTWKDARNVLPDDMDKALVCQTQNGKIITFNSCGAERTWKFHVDKYHVKYWAYQSELIANQALECDDEQVSRQGTPSTNYPIDNFRYGK